MSENFSFDGPKDLFGNDVQRMNESKERSEKSELRRQFHEIVDNCVAKAEEEKVDTNDESDEAFEKQLRQDVEDVDNAVIEEVANTNIDNDDGIDTIEPFINNGSENFIAGGAETLGHGDTWDREVVIHTIEDADTVGTHGDAWDKEVVVTDLNGNYSTSVDPYAGMSEEDFMGTAKDEDFEELETFDTSELSQIF